MSYNATVLADSVSPAGYRVTSLEMTYPRFILAEKNTHRVLSRGTASSRAIKVEDRIKHILENPFVPEAFSKNQRGMQASEELRGDYDAVARRAWLAARDAAVMQADILVAAKVHKQHANRLLEPYAWCTAIVTATEWANWDALRVSKLAQPEMYKIAGMMREARLASKPLNLGYGEWHLPYVTETDGMMFEEENRIRRHGLDPVKVCVGRCAAVSYERQSPKTDMEKDAARCDKLVGDGHMSPLEHALRPMNQHELGLFGKAEYYWDGVMFSPTGRVRYFLGNVEGWVQYRKLIPGEDVYRGA